MPNEHANVAKLILGVTFSLLGLGYADSARAEGGKDTVSLTNVISEMAKAERRLLNVKVISDLRVERRAGPEGPWQKTEVGTSSTAWYNGLPASKARVDVGRQVLRWEGGPVGFCESSYSCAYDGQFGRLARHAEGPAGNAGKVRRGEITAEAPRLLRSSWLDCGSGAAFSLNFAWNERGKALSRVLAEANRLPVSIGADDLDGKQCVRISVGGNGPACETYWVDPSRGWALLGRDLVNTARDGSNRLVRSDRVTELAETKGGVWYPRAAYREWPEANQSWARFVYKATEIEVNSPDFDESIFTIRFPPGYTVFDKTRGIRNRIVPDPEVLDATIDRIVSEAQAAEPNQIAADSRSAATTRRVSGSGDANAGLSGPSGSAGALRGPNRNAFLYWLVPIALVACAGVWWTSRRRRPSTRSLMGCRGQDQRWAKVSCHPVQGAMEVNGEGGPV